MNVQPHASTGLIGGGAAMVGEPPPAYVESMPPEPLYEQMSDSPGDGAVWIDGYWHWSGYEWVWVSGKWEREQAGYVYVEPSYAYDGNQDAYLYTPGYWAQPDRVPRDWFYRNSGDGRPNRVSPPQGTGWHRRPVASGNPIPPGGGGTWHPHPPRPTTNDPGGPQGGGTYYPPPPPRTGGGGISTPPPNGPPPTPGGTIGSTAGGVIYVPRPVQSGGPVGRMPGPPPGTGVANSPSTHPGSSRDLNWRQQPRFEPAPGGPISRPISAPPPPQQAPAPQAPPPQPAAPPPPPPNWQPVPPPHMSPHSPPPPHPPEPGKPATRIP